MEPSLLRPKSAKHSYRNRLSSRPKSGHPSVLDLTPKQSDVDVTLPARSQEPDKKRLESASRPKSAHPRAKSRRGVVVDIFNSQNSTYTDITVIADSRDAHVPVKLPDPARQSQKKVEKTKKPSESNYGNVPVNKMATDSMKENKTTGNVKVIAHHVSHQAESITRCYYRPLTPIITNEDEYYANLDPVEYFNDTTVQDLPIYREKPKTVDPPPIHTIQLPKPPKKAQLNCLEKPRPWSESIKDQNKALQARKKYVNTKNAVYAMFFDDKYEEINVDAKKYLRPLTDDKVITHNTRTAIQHGGIVGNTSGPKPSQIARTDGNKLLGNRANNTPGHPGSEKSWIPRYTGLAHNTHQFTSYGKTGSRDVSIAKVQANKDPKSKYRYELRPFSEGVNIMAENEMIRFRANKDLYSSKYNVDKLLAKHKKKCGNFPNGFDLKPRRNNLVGPDNLQIKHTGAINGRLTPRPRKLKPIQGIHKS